jgi:hypothetical protein
VPSAVRVVDRLQDQADVQGPPVDGAFLRYDAATDKYIHSGGASGDLSYTHTQAVASTVWTVNHNLGKKPAVTVVDSGENVVFGDVTYVDLNILTVTFLAAFGGKCFCS